MVNRSRSVGYKPIFYISGEIQMGFRVINVDVVASSLINPSNAASPQVMKTYNLDVTDDEYVVIIANVRVTVAAGGVASVAQTLQIQIAVGPQTYTLPFITTSTLAAAGDEYIFMMFPVVSRAGDTVNVQLMQAGANDAHTQVGVQGFYIQAWSGTKPGT